MGCSSELDSIIAKLINNNQNNKFVLYNKYRSVSGQ